LQQPDLNQMASSKTGAIHPQVGGGLEGFLWGRTFRMNGGEDDALADR